MIAAYQPWRIGEMAIAAYERLRSQGEVEPRLPAVDRAGALDQGDRARTSPS